MTRELNDYSGDYKPDLKYEDFSKAALIRLWQLASKHYFGIARSYITDLRKRHGEKEALAINDKIWMEWYPTEFRIVLDAMNIKGNDVETLFKFIQCYGGVAGLMNIELDLKNKDHGIFTVRRCPILESNERRNDPEAIHHLCGMDVVGYEMWGHVINPKITTKCLKLPPRKDKNEIVCQWEWKLEE